MEEVVLRRAVGIERRESYRSLESHSSENWNSIYVKFSDHWKAAAR
jgi:hypothetical protein